MAIRSNALRCLGWLSALPACADVMVGQNDATSGDTGGATMLVTTDAETTTSASRPATTAADESASTSTTIDPTSSSATTADADTSSNPDASSAGTSSTSGNGSSGESTGIEPGPPFVEMAIAAGFDHAADVIAPAPNCLIDAVDPPVPGLFCSPERYAGGAAVTDVDGDGDLDVYVSRPYSADLLYLNDGAGNFEDAALDLGLVETLPTSGAAFADIDDDGDQDLVVTTLGEYRHYLFVNEAGVFVEDGEDRGAIVTEHQHAGSTPVFGDYDLDGDLDLYVGEWRTLALGTQPSHARLLRNMGPDAPGYFEDVTVAAGLDLDQVYLLVGSDISGTFVLSAGWADMDGDDYPDLLLASDFDTSRLFWNAADGTFVDGTLAAGVGTDENGMGSAVADYDSDGDLDWFVSSIFGGKKTGNRLYRNEGDRVFTDATDAAGVREGEWGWGAAFFDHDLDGDLDLVETDGWYATEHLEDPMLAWTNDGAAVLVPAQEALGLTDTGQGRGLVTFDADDDGDLEVLVVNNGGDVKYFRNDTPRDDMHWLRVRAPGTSSNGDGIGAVVTVDTTAGPRIHEIGGTSHYLGHGPREAHFGVGSDVVVDVHVRWPASGAQVDLIGVAADQVLVVVEP